MRTVFTVFAMHLLLMFPTGATEKPALGQEAMANIMTGGKGWEVLIELTTETKPSDRATKLGFEFVRRGSEVVGRTTNLLAGANCEFRVVLRDDGFDFQAPRGCSGANENEPLTSVEYDAKDEKYPFKRLTAPMKWWLTPKR